MASESGGKPLTLPGISASNNLSGKNLTNATSLAAHRWGDRAMSMDSSAGDSDGLQSVSAHGARIHGSGVALSSRQLQHLFPYHISVDRDFNVIQLGEKLYPLVRATLSPNSAKKRLNQHISKYFKIVSPSTHVNCWEAKTLANLHVYSPASSGLIELELVGREALVSSTTQRYNDDALMAAAARLTLRGRFHELTGYFAPPAPVIYEQDIDGHEGSDGSGKMEESSYVYLFLLYPSNAGGLGDGAHEDWASGAYAHISAATIPSGYSRSVSEGTGGGDLVAKLMAENAALVAENARLKGEAKTQDVRGMIGNVAHDLKTPLAAFMGGVDLINDMAQECATVLGVEHQLLLEQQAEAERITPRTSGVIQQRMNLVASLRTILRSITQQASGVRDINQFMTMTINRCIDYTKAAQGVKLVPRNETINLTEVLAMPINCMIASQNKVAMRLLPPPEDICSHVITDKIWLQENILCLLSNAVKYSNAGRVDIQISLFPAQSLTNAAAVATAAINTTTSTGSHKNEPRAPTENVVGPLSAKQVLAIHNQRSERAAAASLASAATAAAAASAALPGAKARGRAERARQSRSVPAQPPNSRRSSTSSVVSTTSAKVLSPVVPPHRQTISVMQEVPAQLDAVRAPLGITIPPNTYTGTAPVAVAAGAGAGGKEETSTPKKEEEEVTKGPPPRSPRITSGRMSSTPRANTTTDPLSNPSLFSEPDEVAYHTSSGSTAASPKAQQQLSPINNKQQLHSSAIAHGAVSPTAQNIAAATAGAGSYPPQGRPGSIGGTIGSVLGFGKGKVGGSSPAQSQPVSRRTSHTTSRSVSQSQSRNNSTEVDSGTPHQPSSVSSPIGYLRNKMGKADRLRQHVNQSFDSNDETGSLATSTVHEDIAAMARRGSFSSVGDGEGEAEGEGEGEDRASLYSDASSSRQVSTDSRQYSSESRGYRFSADLSMGNLDEDEKESAKTILSQHNLLYPTQHSGGFANPLSYSPSGFSYITSNNNYISNTPVAVFPAHGSINKPLQRVHASSGRSHSNTPPVGGEAHSPTQQATALLLIEISDTGIGLSEADMSKLYSPFMQAQRLAGGTGLGLYSLSKRLDALGGHYGVESRKDGQPGSLFWFAIPYREDADAASSFCKLQRSGSSRLEDLILSAQPTLAELMAAGEISEPKKGRVPAGVAAVGDQSAGFEDPANKTSSSKSVADPEPQAESAPHSLHCSSQSSGSTRTSQGSIPPMSPTLRAQFVASPEAGNQMDSPTETLHASFAPPHIGATNAPMHFLLVDDSDAILKFTSMLLIRSGHSVERAENGVIALDKLAESAQPGARRFDVVVMDLQMPVLDGLEATKRLREIEDERAIAAEVAADLALDEGKGAEGEEAPAPERQIVIGLSANGDEDTMQAAYAAGVDWFIEKPFSLQKLVHALEEIKAQAQG